MSDSIAPTINELEKARDQLVKRLITGQPWFKKSAFPDSFLTVEAKGRKRHGSGYYQPAVWRSKASDVASILGGIGSGKATVLKKQAQITLFAETLAEPLESVLTELVHQIAHAALDGSAGIEGPCTKWHTRTWADLVESRFHVKITREVESARGFAVVAPTPKLTKLFDSLKINRAVFDKHRVKTKRTEKGSKLRKYSCPCGQNIRVGSSTWPGAICVLCLRAANPTLMAEVARYAHASAYIMPEDQLTLSTGARGGKVFITKKPLAVIDEGRGN